MSDEEILLQWLRHTLLETHLSLLCEISVASAVSSSALCLSSQKAGRNSYAKKFLSRAQFLHQHYVFLLPKLGEILCKDKNKMNLEEQEKYTRSFQPGGILRSTIPTTFRPYNITSNSRATFGYICRERPYAKESTEQWCPKEEGSRKN